MSSSAFCIPEYNFQERYLTEVIPFFQKFTQGHFRNSSGVKINFYYRLSERATKTLVVLPGRTEPAKKYAEIFHELQNDDVNFFVMDHQGQGESDHLLEDSQKGHVEKFSNYIEDFTLFMDSYVLPMTSHTQHIFLAHSMGSLVGVGYMQEHPKVFSKAVLNSPMFGVNTFPLSNGLMKKVTARQIHKGMERFYASFTRPYNPFARFWLNPNTSSVVRFEKSKELFALQPEIAIGGPTVRWLDESLKAGKEIRSKGNLISASVLILKGGRDIVVRTKLHNQFCGQVEDCKVFYYPRARHEILFEQDYIRDLAISAIKNFLEI